MLSRLETGARPLTLAHLARLAPVLGVSPGRLLAEGEPAPDLDRPGAGDDQAGVRHAGVEHTSDGRTWVPLTAGNPDAPQAYKVTLMPSATRPVGRTHPGHQWIFVLTGLLHARIGTRARVLAPGATLSFSTRLSHTLEAVDEPTEILAVFDAGTRRD